MVIAKTRARRLAERAAGGTGKKRGTFLGGRGVARAEVARRALAAGEPMGRAYLRYGLLVLGGVGAGILLGRRSRRGGAPPPTFSDAGGTGADATERTNLEPAGVPDPPSGPARGPADSPVGGGPSSPRPAARDAAPPASPSFAEPPRPGDVTGRSDEDLAQAPVEGGPSDRSSGTPSGEGAATAEGPPAPQGAEQPSAEEAPSIAEDLPPPPQAPDAELPPPPPTPNVAEELPPPPPAEGAQSTAEELPPPPEVGEAELPPPPVPENALDELPPPPVPEEQDVGDVPAAPPSAGPSAEPAVEATQAEGPRVRRRVTATMAARREAEELGVDLLEVEGTGTDGKITVEDVRRRKGGQAPSE